MNDLSTSMSQDLYLKTVECPFPKLFPSQLDKNDQFFMQLAYNQAIEGWRAGEVPIGAIIVKDLNIIGSMHNTVETTKDPTAHAELLAITQASKAVGDWRLNDCTLYVTKEPCIMCTGAAILGRLRRVVFACTDLKAGGMGGSCQLHLHPGINHKLEITTGILESECLTLLQGFFKSKREFKKC
jgi:tRNA(adenine34) deaminase